MPFVVTFRAWATNADLWAALLFAGLTRVGKTRSDPAAGQGARGRGAAFDMSEHMERHTVSRLIGAPPGYVGFEQEGC